MENRRMLLQVLLYMALTFSLILPVSAAGASATVPLPDDHSTIHLVVDSPGVASAMALNTPQGQVTPMVAAGYHHTVGLKADGSVIAVGDNDYGQCEVGGWTDIIQVAAGGLHTVGLKTDGTVVAVGSRGSGECDVGGWTDIVQVAAGRGQTVGLKDDGAVIAAGRNICGQCDVGGWTSIVGVAAGEQYTVGLESDGTVVATDYGQCMGYNDYGQGEVGGWTDITQVAASGYHTVGLKSDGTVVAVGRNYEGQGEVSGWTDIVQVTAGGYHTVGVKSDGTVVAVESRGSGECEVGGWTDIVQVTAGAFHTVGLRSDGTVVAVGYNEYGQCEVGGWNLGLVVPSSQCVLTISSTAGGSVTTPGEGAFTYDAGTVVDLVAEPEEGYRFVEWTGDVDTIADVDAASTTINVDGDYSIKANFVDVDISNAGIKAGDWIKLEYTITGWPAGQPWSEWLELEFISVEGTSASVNVTLGMSDGQELSDTVPVNLGEGGGEAFGLSGFVIPPNLGRGDSVYFSGYGDVTIEGETTRTYAGVRRRVVYASLSQSVPYQDAVQLTYYWDKQTGVMVEASTIWGDVTATCKVTETNMLEADSPAVGVKWWLWVIIAVVIAGVAVALYRLRKRNTPPAPTSPSEGS